MGHDQSEFRERLQLAVAVAALTLGGCSTTSKMVVAPTSPENTPGESNAPSTAVARTSPPELLRARGTVVKGASAAELAALAPKRDFAATLPPQPVPAFIDTVFGQLLGVPYFLGPGVAQRREVIALRSPETLDTEGFLSLTLEALKSFDLVVSIEAGSVRITEAPGGQLSNAARVLRSTDGMASGSITTQVLVLRAVSASSLAPVIEELFGDLRLSLDEVGNTVTLTGSNSEVRRAAAMIRQLDEPRFADGEVARVRPVYWSADKLADAVAEILRTEGYLVGADAGRPSGAIAILPVPYADDLLVFSTDEAGFERALYWAEQLDNPDALGDQEGAFVYQVRNSSAASLGALVAQVAQDGGETSSQQARRSLPRGSSQNVDAEAPESAGGTAQLGRITVDEGGNRLLFRGTPSEFAKIRTLMEQLDTPPRQVLIELTVAEVTLTDETRFGVEWFLERQVSNGVLEFGTEGAVSFLPGSLTATATRMFSRGMVEATLNAFATNQNLNILSTPRLLTRSGGDAQILVGTDVPIITSQRAANAQVGGTTDILQTVQYRQTGIILNVRPVVYGDDRVDIELYQEVSTQQPNTVAAISSPVISNRSVRTQLALREGMTAIVGGLIQDDYSREQTGVPFLKDVPLLGRLFRTDRLQGTKVELLVLVTPYILRDDQQLASATAEAASSINRALELRGPATFTLSPWTYR